jgi:peroxiredoxin
MLEQGQIAPPIPGLGRDRLALVVFFETDCPTCQLTLPYLNALSGDSIHVLGISQDSESTTREFVRQMKIAFPVETDRDLKISHAYDPQSVPTIFLLGQAGQVLRTLVGFDKAALN